MWSEYFYFLPFSCLFAELNSVYILLNWTLSIYCLCTTIFFGGNLSAKTLSSNLKLFLSRAFAKTAILQLLLTKKVTSKVVWKQENRRPSQRHHTNDSNILLIFASNIRLTNFIFADYAGLLYVFFFSYFNQSCTTVMKPAYNRSCFLFCFFIF